MTKLEEAAEKATEELLYEIGIEGQVLYTKITMLAVGKEQFSRGAKWQLANLPRCPTCKHDKVPDGITTCQKHIMRRWINRETFGCILHSDLEGK